MLEQRVAVYRLETPLTDSAGRKRVCTVAAQHLAAAVTLHVFTAVFRCEVNLQISDGQQV